MYLRVLDAMELVIGSKILRRSLYGDFWFYLAFSAKVLCGSLSAAFGKSWSSGMPAASWN
jgi:hypothetical protein